MPKPGHGGDDGRETDVYSGERHGDTAEHL